MTFEEQMTTEMDGATAFHVGQSHEDCPYDEGSDQRMFWISGFDQCGTEQHYINKGSINFCSTMELFHYEEFANIGTEIPIKEAVKRGLWKPKYHDI